MKSINDPGRSRKTGWHPVLSHGNAGQVRFFISPVYEKYAVGLRTPAQKSFQQERQNEVEVEVAVDDGLILILEGPVWLDDHTMIRIRYVTLGKFWLLCQDKFGGMVL